MADTAGHDVHFESADAGASLTYPQQAGTVRKNGFLVIKGRPCKVSLLSICSTVLAPLFDISQCNIPSELFSHGRFCGWSLFAFVADSTHYCN